MMRAFIYDMDGVIVDSEIIHMKAEKSCWNIMAFRRMKLC